MHLPGRPYGNGRDPSVAPVELLISVARESSPDKVRKIGAKFLRYGDRLRW